MTGSAGWLLANSNTKNSLDGLGALKGAPCTITDITYDDNGNAIVEFSWTSISGKVVTREMNVEAGRGIKDIIVDREAGTFVVQYTDDTLSDPKPLPEIPDNTILFDESTIENVEFVL